MKPFVVWVVAAVSVIGVGACASVGDGTVSFTTAESIVSGCQKVGDVGVEKDARVDVKAELADQARSKGANFVLRASDDAVTGAAYRCEAPRVASR